MDNFDLRKYLVENKVTTNSKIMKEEAGSFDSEFTQAYTTFLDDHVTPEEAEICNFTNEKTGEEKNLEYPSVSEVVSLTLNALKAAGIDSVDKLYTANKMKYGRQSLADFFESLEQESYYSGMGYSIVPGIHFFFGESSGEED